MTYIEFHFIFILPALFFAFIFAWPSLKYFKKRAVAAILFNCLLAVFYTTPWDNYLVYKGVWNYLPERVLGRLGYVPFEEYAFFILQTILTSFIFFGLCARMTRLEEFSQKTILNLKSAPTSRALKIFIILLSFITGAGVGFLYFSPSLYLGLILSWAIPVVILQWYIGGSTLWKYRNLYFFSLLISTVYLWIVDSVAIQKEIWTISTFYTLGPKLGILPLEEALFFFLTNVLVIQGVLLHMKTDFKKK